MHKIAFFCITFKYIFWWKGTVYSLDQTLSCIHYFEIFDPRLYIVKPTKMCQWTFLINIISCLLYTSDAADE